MREGGEESGGGDDEGVVVDEAEPFGLWGEVCVEHGHEGEISGWKGVFVVRGLDEGDGEAEFTHVGLQGGHTDEIGFLVVGAGDDDEESGVGVGEPAFEEWY